MVGRRDQLPSGPLRARVVLEYGKSRLTLGRQFVRVEDGRALEYVRRRLYEFLRELDGTVLILEE